MIKSVHSNAVLEILKCCYCGVLSSWVCTEWQRRGTTLFNRKKPPVDKAQFEVLTQKNLNYLEFWFHLVSNSAQSEDEWFSDWSWASQDFPVGKCKCSNWKPLFLLILFKFQTGVKALDLLGRFATLNRADTVWKDAPFFLDPFLDPPPAASALIKNIN